MKRNTKFALFNILSLMILSLNVFCVKRVTFASNYSLDFSRIDSLDYNKVMLSSVIEKITEKSFTPGEKKYFDSNDLALIYEDKIPTNNVSYSVDSNIVSVTANPYSYQDKNNNSITYIPTNVFYGKNIYKFENVGTSYQTSFSYDISLENIKVEYETILDLDDLFITNLINEPYNLIKDFVTNNVRKTKEDIYQKQLKEYNDNQIAYQNYLNALEIYNINLPIYDQYVIDKKIYDEKKSAYDNYLIEMTNYENELALYNKYLEESESYPQKLADYNAYIEALEIFNATNQDKIAAYDEYLAKMEKVNYRLSVMDLIKDEMNVGRNIYNAIVGDSVTTVLQRKDDLQILEADSRVIDDAEKATNNLRSIFTNYYSLQTDQAKYNYFANSSNYAKIKDNFELLLRSLDKLYRSGRVSAALKTLEKEEKYVILLAELSIFCQAIDDKNVENYEQYTSKKGSYIDSSYTFNGKTTAQILDGFTFEDKNMAYPTPINTYPDIVEKPIEPTKVEKPIEPVKVLKPTMPDTITNPGIEPVKVLKPILPEIVIKIENEPTPYVFEDYIDILEDEYNKKILTEHDISLQDYKIKVSSFIEKNLNSTQKVTVSYYDLDSKLIESYVTDINSYVVFTGNIPTKNPDEIYEKYDFIGWVDKDGQPFDNLCVTKDINVYPSFVGTYKEYVVTWIIDNKKIEEKYHYGQMPSFKQDITKDPTNTRYYTFNSWNNQIVSVKENATYKAIFTSSFYVPNLRNDSGAEIEINDDYVKIFNNTIGDKSINLSILFQQIISDNYLGITLENNVYSLAFSSTEVKKMQEIGVNYLSISIQNVKENEYKFSFEITNKDSIKIEQSLIGEFTLRGIFDKLHSTLYYKDNTDLVPTRFAIDSDKIYGKVDVSKKYQIYPSYNIYITCSSDLSLTTNKVEAREGEIISFTKSKISEGKELDKFYVIDSNSNLIQLEGNRFVMPSLDVYIVYQSKDIIYTISFVVDDIIISTKTYTYGQEVEIPNNPIKANDEFFSYLFTGWDKNITKVTKNETYTATFLQSKILNNETKNESLSSKYLTYFVIGIVGISLILLIVLVLRKNKL